jgi:hypothetical protein
MATTNLLNRPIWGGIRANDRAYLDANPLRAPRDFLILHRLCAYSTGESLENFVQGDGKSVGASPAIESFLASSAQVCLGLFSAGIPGVSRPLASEDREVLGDTLLASLERLSYAPEEPAPSSPLRVTKVSASKVVDLYAVWEDVGVGESGTEAAEESGGREATLAWRNRSVHARGRSVVVTVIPPPDARLISLLHSFWHENTLRPARRAACLVTVAHCCTEEGGGGESREAVHTALWECAFEAAVQERPAWMPEFLQYMIASPLVVTRGWRLVAWDGMDAESLTHHAGSIPSAAGGAAAAQAGSGAAPALIPGLSLPSPTTTSIPLLRVAGEQALAVAGKEMLEEVESALDYAGLRDQAVMGKWCAGMEGSLGRWKEVLEASASGRRLLNGSLGGGGDSNEEEGQGGPGDAGKMMGEGGGQGKQEQGGQQKAALETLRSNLSLTATLLEEAQAASLEMADLKRVTPWSRRVRRLAGHWQSAAAAEREEGIADAAVFFKSPLLNKWPPPSSLSSCWAPLFVAACWRKMRTWPRCVRRCSSPTW